MLKIPYGKQTITGDDINAVVETLKSDFLTQGPKIEEFERVVAIYHHAKYGVAFSSGTAALHGAYHALGIKNEDEVITSPISFVATSNAAAYCGGRPIFCDIDEDTNCIDVSEIENKVTDKTRVIAPVSFAGFPADLKAIRKIADKHGLKVLHDAAHAIGSERNGSFGLEYADMAVLSFHPVKHIACGEGGMVLTNSQEYCDSLRLFRSHGITKNDLASEDGWFYEMRELGYNYRMTDIQASLGISQMKRLADNLKKRNELAKRYDESFAGLDWLRLPPRARGCDLHSYHLYGIRIVGGKSRRDFYDYMHKNNILVQVHYIPIHTQPYYMKTFGCKRGDFPKAEKYYAEAVSLPMFHSMDDEEIEYVISKMKGYANV